ncbi:MAG TPA: hypothetical protein VM120_07140 [Bryobacteraceae bacterium]|nr:hypothetical protein [Bryobacteraceae bacterium]
MTRKIKILGKRVQRLDSNHREPRPEAFRDVISQAELKAVLLLEQCQNANFSGLTKRYFAGASVEPGELTFEPGSLADVGKYAGPCSGLDCLSASVGVDSSAAPPEPEKPPSAAAPEGGLLDLMEHQLVREFIKEHDEAALLDAIRLYEKLVTMGAEARVSALSYVESCALGNQVDSETNCRLLGLELLEETYPSLVTEE